MNLVTIITTRSKSCSVKTLHAILRLNMRCLQRNINNEITDQIFQPHETVGCLVFPGVNEGIDWDMFKEKIKSDSKEPPSQMGLHFDTRVGKKISKDIYQVSSTDARVWMMNTKNVMKSIRKIRRTRCSYICIYGS